MNNNNKKEREKDEENSNIERLQSMFDKEVNQYQINFNLELWYLPYRLKLVDWIFDKVDKPPFNISTLSAHIAVFYLDRILSSYQVFPKQLQLIASSCILIAAKMEEKDDEDFPTFQTLVETCNGIYSVRQFNQMEIEILYFFNWKMNVVTVLHFLGYFSPFIFDIETDLLDNNKVISLESFKIIERRLIGFSQFFGDFCLQHYEFTKFKHSAIAATCIFLSRKELNISPIWSDILSHYTTYTQPEIQEIIDLLLHFYSKVQKTNKKTIVK